MWDDSYKRAEWFRGTILERHTVAANTVPRFPSSEKRSCNFDGKVVSPTRALASLGGQEHDVVCL